MKSDLHPPLKHLPKIEWPSDDRLRFEAARQPRDIFDEAAAACSNWSEGTWRQRGNVLPSMARLSGA